MKRLLITRHRFHRLHFGNALSCFDVDNRNPRAVRPLMVDGETVARQ